MGWTSYYVGTKNIKDCMAEEVGRFNSRVKKSVRQGNKFFYLMETLKGEDWVLLMLGRKQNGEFYYKDIQCNPYENGVPPSILKSFTPSNDADKEWLDNQLKKLDEEKKAKKTFNIGDVVECKSSYDIEWGDGFRIPKNQKFFVIVDSSRTRKRVLKQYNVARQKPNGELTYTLYKLSNRTFKNLNKELGTGKKVIF